MIVDTVTEAKAQLSSLIELVLKGEEVIISRAGKPVAVLVAYDPKRRPRKPGALRGHVHIRGDFDDLPNDIAIPFGMGEE